MKKVLQNCATLSTDIVMAGLLSVLNILFFKYAFCIEIAPLYIVAICFIFYFSFALFTHKRTVGQAVFSSCRKMNRQANKSKFVANLLDLSIVCTLSLTLTYFMNLFQPIRYYWVFILSAIIYYALAYITCRTTLGQALFGISLVQDARTPTWGNVLLREIVFKWGPLLLIILLLNVFRYKNPFFNVAYASVLFLFFKFYYRFTTTRNWWNQLAATHHIMRQIPTKRRVFLCAIFLIIGVVSIVYPNSKPQPPLHRKIFRVQFIHVQSILPC